MLAENPLALRYILPDDVYLLRNEKLVLAAVENTQTVAQVTETYTEPAAPATATEQPAASIIAEPVVKITLPPAAEMPATPQPVVQTQVTAFKYLGGYGKQFLVMVNYADYEFMDDAHLKALESTLARLDFTRADIAILNLHQHAGKTYAEIREHFKPERTLILGETALPAGLKQPPVNQVIRAGNRSLLYSFSFTDMLGNKDNIRAFWEQVKTI